MSLIFYDVATDKFREPTQEEFDRCHAAASYLFRVRGTMEGLNSIASALQSGQICLNEACEVTRKMLSKVWE